MEFVTAATIAVVFIVWLIIASKNKSKFGVSLKRSYCPVCNTKQRLIRMPANFNQALYGGTTCPNCKTELNKYGDIIP